MASDLRKQQALEYHAKGRPGKIEVVPTKALENEKVAKATHLETRKIRTTYIEPVSAYLISATQTWQPQPTIEDHYKVIFSPSDTNQRTIAQR